MTHAPFGASWSSVFVWGSRESLGMSGRTVLVTGVSRDLGRTCARALAGDPTSIG